MKRTFCNSYRELLQSSLLAKMKIILVMFISMALMENIVDNSLMILGFREQVYFSFQCPSSVL